MVYRGWPTKGDAWPTSPRLILPTHNLTSSPQIGATDGSCTGSSAAEGVSLTFLLPDLFTAVLAAVRQKHLHEGIDCSVWRGVPCVMAVFVFV